MTQQSLNSNRIAFFPGSFDPFTIGHASIVERALPLFDTIIIAIGVNDSKKPMFTAEERVKSISDLYSENPKVKVIAYSGLTIKAAKENHAKFILRGVRMIQDFEYEKNIAEVNRSISGLETVLLYTLPEHSHISSSIVRELLNYNQEVTSFLPPKMHL